MQRHPLNGMYSAVLAICLALCLPFSSANAQGIGGSDIIGGGGGTPFDVQCPPGEFLVGLFGFTGQIVDGIGMVCAPWLPLHSADQSATTGPPQDGKYFGGRGSNSARMICPPGSALKVLLIQASKGDDPRVVGSIEQEECFSLADPNRFVPSDTAFFGTDQDLVIEQFASCPDGLLANGLVGGSGVFLDRVGLKCATPQAPELITPPPPPTGGVAQAPHRFGTVVCPPIVPPGDTCDVDVFNHQPDDDPQAIVLRSMHTGEMHQVIKQEGGFGLLFGAGGGGRDGWVATDHLCIQLLPQSFPTGAHPHKFGTAHGDVDVFNHQPDDDPQAIVLRSLNTGEMHQVIKQEGGFSLLFGAGGGGRDGWVATDHLCINLQ